MRNMLFDGIFKQHLDSPRPFLHLAGGETMSYGAFLGGAARMAHALGATGLGPGDRLAVQVAKTPEALMLYVASVMAGVVYLPLNTAYTDAELAYFVSDSGAALAVVDPGRAAVPGARRLTLDAGGRGSLAELADDRPRTFLPAGMAGDDLAALLYTSGTTGRAKGAMLTQGNLLSNALALRDLWRFTDADVLLHALPIFHLHGLFVATHTLAAAGGAMIFQPKFDLDEVLDGLGRATSMMGVPTFYTRLLDDPRLTRENVAHVRIFISGSAPLLAETHARFEARTGHRILERYGMTETGMNTSNPYEGERRAGTVGLPLPDVELRITDPESGEELAPGEIGQIEVRGPNVFRGYWGMPEKTAEDLREDGFFITGDLGRVGRDGYVEIVGRGKDLVISGGFNIYPKEIELLLDAEPGVQESAVIGVPHADFGEAVLALVVPKPGETPDPPAMMVRIARSLARFKHPRRIIILDELPRNAMGKVQKNVLRETYRDVFPGR